MNIEGLNLDDAPLIAANKSLKYARNISVTEDLQAYVNEYGWDKLDDIVNINGVKCDVCGIIPVSIGVIIFNTDSNSNHYIQYYNIENNRLKLIRRIKGNFNFNINRPITGDFTYNYKKDLIVVFTEGSSDEANETRVININDPRYDNSDSEEIILNDSEISLLDIIPNIIYPTLRFTLLNNGNLKTGSYQIAIKYKLPDNTYTNYSILHETVIISGDYREDYPVGVSISKSIQVSFRNKDTKYKQYKLAIVYRDESGEVAYETQDISLLSNNNYTINNLEGYLPITLEDIIIKKIAYIKEEDLVNFNNALLRFNVRTTDYSNLDHQLQYLTDNMVIDYTYMPYSSVLNTDKKYFKEGEVYSLFVTYYDYKGNQINSYRIPWKNGDSTLRYISENYSDHQIGRLQVNDSIVYLRAHIPERLHPTIPDVVKGFSVSFVEHNFENSRILSQSVVLRDTEVNNFQNNQTYTGQFSSTSKFRFYPFEFLFNKRESISAKLQKVNTIPISKTRYEGLTINEAYRLKYNNDETRRIARAYTEITKEELGFYNTNPFTPTFNFQYIVNNNTTSDNIAGDSYYRVTSTDLQSFTIVDRDGKYGVVELLNPSDSLYSNPFNQKLQIASSIYSLTEIATLTGDTFLSYLTLRSTTPDKEFSYGNSDKGRESNDAVWIWIFTIPIESKFNIKARYSRNDIEKGFKLYGSSITEREQLYRINYQNDNFINTDTGKGYSLVYNENGTEEFYYTQTISKVDHHISRLIRSDVYNSESDVLTWRYFRSDSYRDLSSNRGAGVSIKTDNRNVYAQQEYGLRLLSVRDTLGNTEEGTSYLGSSDIFDREPVEILYSPSGYIGCSHKFDTHINVTGYYVLDNNRQKIYNIFGSDVKELTSLNAKRWFVRNINKAKANNPYINEGRYFNFNEETNDLIYVQQQDFSISFNIPIQKWVSFHDYEPIFGFTNRKGTFWISSFDNNTNIYRVAHDKYCIFENAITYDSILKLVFNENALDNKLLNSFVWKDLVTIRNNNDVQIVQWYDTIYKIAVHNEDQTTGYKDVKFNKIWYEGRTGVNKINLWRFNNLNDIARSNDFLIDEITFNPSALKVNPKWYKVNKLYSQYIYAIMKWNNSDPRKRYELQEVNAEWLLDNRNGNDF